MARAVVLHGEQPVRRRRRRAGSLAGERELVLVHPYDDPLVMAGQGTVALEMLADEPDLDALVVPIGGGGLVSGIAVAAKALKPAIEIVGVEAALYPSFHNAITGRGSPDRRPDAGRGHRGQDRRARSPCRSCATSSPRSSSSRRR